MCVCVCPSVALVIQLAKQMCCITLSSLACPAIPYFSTLSHKWHYFGKILFNIKWVFWFYLQLLSETLLIQRSIQRDIIINVHRSLHKVPIIQTKLWSNFNSLNRILKGEGGKLKYQISWKFMQWELSYSMQMDGQTDRQTHRDDVPNCHCLQICKCA